MMMRKTNAFVHKTTHTQIHNHNFDFPAQVDNIDSEPKTEN